MSVIPNEENVAPVSALTVEQLRLSKPGRLALFLPQLGGGGAERAMMTIANHSARQGIAVDFVLNHLDGPYLDEVDPLVNLVTLDAVRVWEVLARLVFYLRRRRPAYLLSTLYRQNFLVVLAKKLACCDARLVVREANTFSRDSGYRAQDSRMSKRFKAQVDQFLLPVLYSQADCVVSVSGGVRDDLVDNFSLSRSLIEVVYNPLDLKKIDSLAAQTPEHSWALDNDIPLVVSMGRLVPQKDFPTLIRGFAQARKRREMRLLILGEGNQRSELEELVQDLGLSEYVALPGFVSNPFAIMARSQLFVLTSRWEGIANVCIEALAVGLPVIATDCPSGPAEVLRRGEFGKLIEIGDVDALAETLVNTLDEPICPDHQRARAHDFSIPLMLPEYWRVLGLTAEYTDGR